MTDCPHCRRFREERDEAVEALEAMRREAGIALAEERVRHCADLFHLEPIPARMLLLLLNGRPMKREFLREASGANGTSPSVVDARLVRVRRALAGHGVTLRSRYSLGWSIDAEDCAKIRAMLGEAH